MRVTPQLIQTRPTHAINYNVRTLARCLRGDAGHHDPVGARDHIGVVRVPGQLIGRSLTVRTRTSWRRLVALTAGLVTGLVGANYAAAQPAPTERIMLRLDLGSRAASRTFADTVGFTLFSEQGQFQADYEIKQDGVIEGGITFRLWRNLAVGLGVMNYRSVNSAKITSEVPHPLFFDLRRTTTGVAVGLERKEIWANVSALWMMQFTDWLVVSASAGPSLVAVRQDLVSSVQHTEIGFPFDELIFVGQMVDGRSAVTSGVNLGIDVDTFFVHKLPFLNRYKTMEHVGIGLLIRYVRGSVVMEVGGDPVDVDLGGLQLTSGLRLWF